MVPSASAAVIYAVVVGFNGSPSPDVPRLRFADDDAAEYARLLREAGARTTLLTTLDDDSRGLERDARIDGPPTRDALLAALARIDGEMARDGKPAELFVIYSGHGDVDHGEGFVMLDGSHLTRGDLYERVLGGRRATRIHVIVDACKSYFLVYSRGGGGSGGVVERRHRDAPFVEPASPARFPNVGFTLSTSSAADSHEWEAYGGGVFSHEVRSALRGAADADGDGSVSYDELGAFVDQANAAIPNARFRPRFTVAAPTASPAGGRTALLAWTGAPATNGGEAARRVLLDVPRPGHVSVEDGLGRRLLDAHPSGPGSVLHLPASATLYLWSAVDDHEYTIDAASPPAGEVRLSALIARPRRVASRGALHEAFRHLFELPYGERTVDAYLARPAQATAADEPTTPPPEARWTRWRPWKIGALTLTAGSALAGIASSAAAAGVRHGAEGLSQSDRVGANQTIGQLNGAAIGLYAVAGASAVAWAILMLWPSHTHPATTKLPPPSPVPSVGVAPGPGELGLSFAASW